MTRAEVMELLDKLELSSYMNRHEVRDRIKELGYNCSQISVRDGATKICLVFEKTDFIVKWSYNCDDEDSESLTEYYIYTCAVKAGLACFFPKTEVLGKWNDVTVIIQDKVDYSAYDCSEDKKQYYQHIANTVTNRIFSKMERSFYDRNLDTTWGKLVISLYGKKVTKKLCEFIQKYKINDLHSLNIGYKNNRPVILDFSGYYRD